MKKWYAVLVDENDNDWGTGSADLEEAKKMAVNYGDAAYIAEIEDGDDPVCIHEIKRDGDGWIDDSGEWR